MKRINNIKYFGVLFYCWALYHLAGANKDHCTMQTTA